MKVTIFGPNLANQDNGAFEVHASGCKDIGRSLNTRVNMNGNPPWSIDVDCRREIVYGIYDDIIRESEGQMTEQEAYDMCYGDIHFMPCLNGLQERG